MNISGFSSGSELLNDIFASSSTSKSNTSSGSTSASDDTTSFSGSMTISQIRDKVDQMALNGQLTTSQQMHLIAAGFQDMDAAHPSYQPAGEEGYTRSSNQTIDFTSTLQSMADFDTAYGNLSSAAIWSGLADLFKQSNTASSLNLIA